MWNVFGFYRFVILMLPASVSVFSMICHIECDVILLLDPLPDKQCLQVALTIP